MLSDSATMISQTSRMWSNMPWSRCWVKKSRTNWPPLTDLEKRLTPVRILRSTSALTQLQFIYVRYACPGRRIGEYLDHH
jgi:hypothetical protein